MRNQLIIGEMTLRKGKIVWDLNARAGQDWGTLPIKSLTEMTLRIGLHHAIAVCGARSVKRPKVQRRPNRYRCRRAARWDAE